MTSSTRFDDRYDDPDRLRDQVRQLLRYRTTIALGIVVGLLGGLLMTLLRTGGYTSASEVLVRSTTDPFSTFGVSLDHQVSMGTERQIALSTTLAARAAKEAGVGADALRENLRVTNQPNTQILRFEYTANSPKRAARAANALAEAYLADRKARSEATVKRMTGGLEQQVAALTKEGEGKADEATAPGRRDQIVALRKRISDIRSYDTAGGDLVRRAEPSAAPAGPGPAWLLGIGLVTGLLGGIVVAWLRSALEPRARSVSEVEGALGAPVLGLLPGAGAGPDDDLLVVGRTDGERAEAYRTLAFRLRRGEKRTDGPLLVVAPKGEQRGEAVAVNLAAAFAETGDDVVLLDATGGTPGLPARLPMAAAEPGGETAGVTEGRVAVGDEKAGRFTLLSHARGTGGDDLPLSSRVTRALASAGSGTQVLVVTRPLLENADGLTVAQRVAGVLVVGGLDDTRRDDLKRVRELIGCSGGHVVGAVLDTTTRPGPLRRLLDAARTRRAAADGIPTPAAAPTPVKPAEEPAAKPGEEPAAKPAEEAATKTADKPAAKPAGKTPDKPVGKTAVKPVGKPAQEAAKPTEEAATKPVGKPVGKTAEEPAREDERSRPEQGSSVPDDTLTVSR
ncbi:hypothetical protein ACIGO8_25330 [Streptomyces sp. NPDC053493]|uniref:hypothetical protein n=1 Tax=Streptomyces sp. NPDC053493 TaxID=3365705 RepID=UPI0037D9837A